MGNISEYSRIRKKIVQSFEDTENISEKCSERHIESKILEYRFLLKTSYTFRMNEMPIGMLRCECLQPLKKPFSAQSLINL